MIFKLSVLASGVVLLDGKPITLADLESALDGSKAENPVVWYYRENATGEPPAAAMQVMKLIVAKRVPIRLSSKPDFSDAVTPQLAPDKSFASVRQKAAFGKLVIARPDGNHMLLPAMDRNTVPAEAVASVEKLLPSSTKRNVAVIADTNWTMANKPSLQAANQAIPFFGLLMGLVCIGHSVWIFNPAEDEMLSAGLRDADVLILDGARVDNMPAGWQSTASSVMRRAQFWVHDRATNQLKKPN